MKILQNNIFLSVVLMMSLVACEQNINIDLPYSGDKIVVNAILTKDSLVYARVTKGAPTDKDVSSFEEISGAKVDLYENGILKETLGDRLYKNKRFYISSTPVKTGLRYDLKITATGLKNVEGSDVIPEKPFFVPVELIKQRDIKNNLYYGKLKFKIKDPAGVKNYYRLRIYPSRFATPLTKNTVYYNALDFKIDNFVDQGGFFAAFGDDMNRVDYFTDETFDGQEITLTATVDLYSQHSAMEFNALAPELTQLSRSAYLYFDSKRKQNQNEENPFAEAVVVYNNIQNGFGIVGGAADSLAIIRSSN
ncbi:MAG: hypothetical protein BGN92_15310 [Sphingobacteriales bacterium 41-5]|nr:MAG: hypothetical protein BGN92_15310 [Sphingobacteriales bacterium 41-5]